MRNCVSSTPDSTNSQELVTIQGTDAAFQWLQPHRAPERLLVSLRAGQYWVPFVPFHSLIVSFPHNILDSTEEASPNPSSWVLLTLG